MRRAGRILAVVLVALCGAAGRAGAGTFEVRACGEALNRSWVASGGGGTLGTSEECPPGGGALSGLAAYDVVGGGPTLGGDAQWSFSAPSGASIEAVTLDRSIGRNAAGWWPYVASDKGVLDDCTLTACPSDGLVVRPGDGASSVRFGVTCASPPCANGGTSPNAWVVVRSATVTVSDESPPSITNVGGALWATGGFHHGVEQVTFDATDNVGMRSTSLWVDGAPAGSSPQACDSTLAVPCPQLPGASTSLDTATLTDGSHTVQIGGVDAASNEERSALQPIVVDNTAPAAPVGLTVGGGEGYRIANAFDVSWTNPEGQIAPLARIHEQVCAASGSPCAAAQVIDSATPSLAGLTVPGPGEWVVSVWLEDAAGNASGSQSAQAVLRLGPLGVITTTSPGLTPRRPARAPLSIRILRVVRSGRKLLLSGSTSKLPHAALQASFRFRSNGRLRTVRAKPATPRPDGRFRLSFPLPPGTHGRPRGTMMLRFPGDARYLPRTLKLSVPRPAH
jgi:hypothetical protein